MSMSTHVIGFRPPDEKWKKMKAAWDALEATGMHWEYFPDELLKFFNDEPPDNHGIEVDLPLIEWKDDAREGYELKIADIPENVIVIRFYNSW